MPNMKISSTRLAAAGTIVALGALGAIAFASGSSSPPTTTPPAAAAARPKVRTIVEHRDVYVTRNAKRSQAPSAGAPAAAQAIAASSDPAAARPVPTADRSAGSEAGVCHGPVYTPVTWIDG